MTYGVGGDIQLLSDGRGKLVFSIASVLVVIGSLIALEVPGIVVALATLGAWIVLGTPFAIGTATVLIVSMLPPEAPLSALIGAALVVASIAFTPHFVEAYPLQTTVATAVMLSVLGGIAVLSLEVWPLWAVSILTLLCGFAAAFGLHRLQLLQLDELPEETS